MQKYGKDNVIAVFMDTGWEHELTYKHIEEVIKQIGCIYIKLRGKYTFLSLAFKKKRFPSTKARFCTEELKIKPFIDWVLAQPYDMIIVQGIRAEESASHKWYADRKQTTVLEFDKPVRNAEHPTMKPIPLISYQVTNSSKNGDIVMDSFGGSGTTMVTCEQLNRKCRMVEYDPKYCQVILDRMKKLQPSIRIEKIV